jgi:hypothetical protein
MQVKFLVGELDFPGVGFQLTQEGFSLKWGKVKYEETKQL